MTKSSQKPTAEYSLSRAYGMYRFYPIDDIAQDLCDLMARKTLTRNQVNILKEKGWNIKVNAEY